MGKVAVLCFENPYNKPFDGAKLDMKTRIHALSMIEGCEIDVYAFNKPEEKEINIDCKKEGIRYFFQYRVGRVGIDGLLSKYPISVYKRYSPECVKELSMHNYDSIIYEGEHMSSYRMLNATKAKKHILRQHDIESIYRLELSKAASSLKHKIGQAVEAWKYKQLENKIDTHFDSILFISNDEKKIFERKKTSSVCKYTFMPPSVTRISDTICTQSREGEILYFGNMELENNALSILWFAEKVFPLIKEKKSHVKLKIIGKISDDNKKKLFSASSSIEVLGYVDDLDKEISKATMIVSPVLFGAGVKIKVIDALSYGQIVCATTKAVEGTELKKDIHLIIEDEPAILAEKCADIISNRNKYEKMAMQGLEFVRNNHSIRFQSKILSRSI